MEPRVSYSLVGAFVILFGAILIVIVLWLVRGGPQKNYRTYYAHFSESVSGVNENSIVRYKGVSVGRVRSMGLDPANPEQVRLVLEIADGTPMKEDTLAGLSAQGLTGLAFVELSGGTRDSPPLTAKPGEDYPTIKTRPSLRLEQTASTLMNNVNQLAIALKDLTEDESRASIRKTMANLAELTTALKNREKELDRLFLAADRTLENTQEMTEKLPALISRATETAAALDAMAQQIGRTGKNIDSLVSGSRQDVQRFTNQTLGEAGLLIAEMRQLTERLQRIAQQVEQNPRSLLFGRRPAPGPGEQTR
jgi:phospholipid/cholesterol/gamma-HCH transport system substrate-binding protein